MRVITRDFLNDNEYRAYPIDDRATFEPYSSSDAAAVNSIITDIRMVLPRDQAAVAFIANITITKLLVTITIMGSQQHPFSPNTPPATANNDQYSALGACVLGRVQVKKALAVPGTIIPILAEIPGVGGWIVFGSGVTKEGTWSFNGASSSMISDQCVTRYDYSGVTSIGKQGYDTAISGKLKLVGQNGIEVVPDSEGVAIQFSGTDLQIKQGLSNYVGGCGGRPESDTCLFSAIKTINGVIPAGSDGQIVLVLDKPLYATLAGENEEEVFKVGSDIKLESFCKSRLQIPDNCATGSAPANSNFLQASSPSPNQVSVNPDILLTVDISSAGAFSYSNFKYQQQHPNRSSVAMYVAETPLIGMGEVLTSLQVDLALNEWQLYGNAGPSMYAYGTLTNNLRGQQQTTYGGEEYKISLGPATLFDELGYALLKVSIDAPDSFEEAGTYIRQSYGLYVNSANSAYSIEIRGFADSLWVLLKDGAVLAAGSIQPNGTGTSIQTYTRENGESATRTIGLTGGTTWNP